MVDANLQFDLEWDENRFESNEAMGRDKGPRVTALQDGALNFSLHPGDIGTCSSDFASKNERIEYKSRRLEEGFTYQFSSRVKIDEGFHNIEKVKFIQIHQHPESPRRGSPEHFGRPALMLSFAERAIIAQVLADPETLTSQEIERGHFHLEAFRFNCARWTGDLCLDVCVQFHVPAPAVAGRVGTVSIDLDFTGDGRRPISKASHTVHAFFGPNRPYLKFGLYRKQNAENENVEVVFLNHSLKISL